MKLGRYIVGLLSGLTFGMLFAPKKGKKLRDELIKKGGESGHEALLALFNAFKDAGMDAVGEMKKLADSEQIQSALSMSKERMHEYLSDIEETGYDIAAKAQGKAEELSDIAVAAGTKFKKRAVEKKKAMKKAVKARVKKVSRKSTRTTKPKASKTATKEKTTSKRKIASKKK